MLLAASAAKAGLHYVEVYYYRNPTETNLSLSFIYWRKHAWIS